MAGDPTGGNAFKTGGLEFGATHLTSMRGLTSDTQWLGRSQTCERVGTPEGIESWYITVDLEDNQLLYDEREEFKGLDAKQRARRIIEAARQIDAQIAHRSVEYITQVNYAKATPETMRETLAALSRKPSVLFDAKQMAENLKSDYLSKDGIESIVKLIEGQEEFVVNNLLTSKGQKTLELFASMTKLTSKAKEEFLSQFGRQYSQDKLDMEELFKIADNLNAAGVRQEELPLVRILIERNLIRTTEDLAKDMEALRHSSSTVPHIELLADKLQKSGVSLNNDFLMKLNDIQRLSAKVKALSDRQFKQMAQLKDARDIRLSKKSSNLKA